MVAGIFRSLIIPSVLALLLQACASESYIVLLENPDGHTGAVTVSGAKGKQLIKTAGDGALLDGSQAPAPVAADKIRKDFGEAMAARPQIPKRFILYFQSDATLTIESEGQLPAIIAEAAGRPVVDVSVVGHTDTMGKADDNTALALVRATVVANLLKEKGMKYHDMTIESHGERNLLVPTPDEVYEPKNRRVEVSVR
ncbi:OmpA family protein [Iodobacter sp. CM08]|uniref:OmpA family protein n=1 Tax=Iodobacter sp. CM08 TaxID=3085902 RepID=UPI0029823425|nr:OmpA family protein [Iodobacter sp. CM08]MDW5417666.1 OmpA family protein [Iodobacter sp. CM08]